MSTVRQVTATALNVTPRGRPRSRMHEIAARIARRFEPAVASAFLDAVTRLQDQISAAALRSAVASGNPALIEAAVAADFGTILDARDMERALFNASTATGRAGADVLEGVTGMSVRFNALHPQVVLFARTQAAELVRAVSDDVREAIRIVLAVGQAQGLTTTQMARAIREVVGLPSNWASAPLNLAAELRAGTFTASRRMSAADKAMIRSRLAKGTVDEAFIAKMQAKYTASLRNRRAMNIARTETLRASHHGMTQGWRQAMEQGVLPKSARRVVVVTPDDRLRETHAMVPGMNPQGVGIDEPFQTPFGPLMNPPWEPNCRCGTGLSFPGRRGVL